MGSHTIAVFGSSEPRPGDAAFEQASELGQALATAGFTVLTGGYGGVMEAASRGARTAGGRTEGVACDVFSHRSPNAWLDQVIPSPDLHVRTQLLIERADGFVVLPGKAGTLAELTFLWALHRAGCLNEPAVVLLGSPWRPLLQYLMEGGLLDRSEFTMADLAETPRETVDLLRSRLSARGPS